MFKAPIRMSFAGSRNRTCRFCAGRAGILSVVIDLEVTVMKQSLVTRKNRKLRKLRERYPDVRIKLFYKRDLERLAQHFRLDLAS